MTDIHYQIALIVAPARAAGKGRSRQRIGRRQIWLRPARQDAEPTFTGTHLSW